MDFELLYGDGIATRAIITRPASWNDVEEAFKKLCANASIELTIQSPPELKGKGFSFCVSEDGNYYLPTMDRDIGFSQLYNYDRNGLYDLYVIGDVYASYMVTEDFEYIKKMVKTFYDTGDVPSDMWYINKPEDKSIVLSSLDLEE